MDWQFKFGIGIAVVFGLLPYAVRDMPQSLSWAGICAGALLAAWGLIPSHDKMPLGPTLLLIACAAGLVGGGAWYWDAYRSSNSETEAGILDNTVSFECYPSDPPTRYREDKPLYTAQIIAPPTNSTEALYRLGWTFFNPGSGEIRPSNDPPDTTIKCIITNYGKSPIFDLSLEIEVFWREVIKTETATKSGDVIASGKYVTPKFRIGESPNNVEYFYLQNKSNNFIYIPLPTAALARINTTGEARSTKLISSASPFPGIFMLPNEIKGPPVASPQAPEPPASPAEK